MGKHALSQRAVISTVLLLSLTMSLCSCETLRKKFIRQKKGAMESKEMQPVLEPQEYPTPQSNPVENYKQHYDLIKAWYRDLWTGVEEKSADGAVKYSIRQILDHIEQMKPLLKEQKAKELDRLADLLQYYQESLSQSRQMRNYVRIESDLRAFDRLLRGKFRDDKLKGEFINQ